MMRYMKFAVILGWFEVGFAQSTCLVHQHLLNMSELMSSPYFKDVRSRTEDNAMWIDVAKQFAVAGLPANATTVRPVFDWLKRTDQNGQRGPRFHEELQRQVDEVVADYESQRRPETD